MTLSKEFSRPAEASTGFFPSDPRVSEREINIFPTQESGVKESGVKARIHELSQMLFAESKKEKEAGKQLQTETPGTDGFEPFVNPQPSKDPLFVNSYNGNCAQQMELNRRGIERVLEIAHLDGQVFLTNLSPNRQRSVEANPDGSIAKKRNIFLGEKLEDDNKDNPLHRVTPIPQGWRIEINDGKIMEDLTEKRLCSEKRQTFFIRKFGKLLKQSLLECILKEKLTTTKDRSFKKKVLSLVANPALVIGLYVPGLLNLDLFTIAFVAGTTLMLNAFVNLSILSNKELTDVDPSANTTRKLDSVFEYFMPQVEIDRVGRAWAFLSLQGRKLVRETR